MGKKALIGIFSVFLVWWIWPMVDPHWEQDRCSFGSVSNEEYRALLKEAKLLIDNKWPSFKKEASRFYDEDQNKGGVGNSRHFKKSINRMMFGRIKALSEKQIEIDGKIAAVHAVLRAHGGSYVRSRNSNRGNKPDQHSASTYFSIYEYKITAFRIMPTLSWRYIIDRWAAFIVSFRPNARGEIHDIHRLSIVNISPLGVGRGLVYDGRSCPPVYSHISTK